MHEYFLSSSNAKETNITTITFVSKESLQDYLQSQDQVAQLWLKSQSFTAKKGDLCVIPDSSGNRSAIVVGLDTNLDLSSITSLPYKIGNGSYKFDFTYYKSAQHFLFYLSWGLGCYQFNAYKKEEDSPVIPALCIGHDVDEALLMHWVSSISLGRDLINTPCCHMGPDDLEDVVRHVATECNANVSVIKGDELLEQNFPAIYAVGKGATIAPRLIDLTWGDESNPKITLVGKGVCFDTGGLNLKPARGMRDMKKDMGGSASVLALARVIMLEEMPVRLRLLIPAVENAIGNESYRPGDVLETRAGISVEVDNTDAEGRLILCDALYEACAESPDYLIDFATLTGARMVALGDDVCAIFSRHLDVASKLQQDSFESHDYMWQLPLFDKYSKDLKSSIADCVNSSSTGKAGTISAALFLDKFVSSDVKWVHVDTPGSFDNALGGCQSGGDVPGIRAIYNYLQDVLNLK